MTLAQQVSSTCLYARRAGFSERVAAEEVSIQICSASTSICS